MTKRPAAKPPGGMGSRAVGVVAVLCAHLSIGAAIAKPTPCAPGRFVVAGSPIGPAGRVNHDAVVFTASDLSIDSACGPTSLHTTATKRGTAVRARWTKSRCAAFRGATVTAMIAAPTCDAMNGVFTWREHGRRRKRLFRATRSDVVTTCTQGQSTYDVIQERVFGAHGCAVVTCHGEHAEGGLSLVAGESYANLVGVGAANAVAAGNGRLRVAPGDPDASFLLRKLRGTLAAGEGDPMPLVGTPLDAQEIGLIEAWIAAGAPATGRVDAAPCLPPLEFKPAPALVPPADGYQLVLDGPEVQPGQEREACIWIPTPNPTDFTVGWWEFSLNPGTHHFAVFQWDKPGVPPLNQWNFNDPGCISGAQFGGTLSGAPQAPYFADALPDGLARVLPAGGYIGLNPHYANDYDAPVPIKVWLNIHPYDGTPQHLVSTVTDFDDMFSIDVPPHTQRLQTGRFVNAGATTMAIVQLQGHMHKRSLRFSARTSDGQALFDNYDWAHPHWQQFTPPLLLAPGDHIDYECLEDNGVTREPKLDGAGNPVDLRFGLTSDDEMCTLSAVWYPTGN